MKVRIALLMLLMVVMIIPVVSATEVNVTLISLGSFTAESDLVEYVGYGAYGSPVAYTVNDGYTIYGASFSPSGGAGVYYVTYYFADGTSIATTYTYTTTSALTGVYEGWIGSTYETDSYYIIPGLPTIWLNNPTVATGITQDTSTLYFLSSINIATTTLGGKSTDSYTFDDTASAYQVLSSSLSKNPITSINAYTLNGGSFTVWVYTQGISSYTTAETNSATKEQTWCDTVGLGNACSIADAIWSAYSTLASVLSSVNEFLKVLLSFNIIFFASGLFVGLNTLYIAIAIVLSIEDSDDMFRSFSSFIRRMRALLRFYMELFKASKEIIKWW